MRSEDSARTEVGGICTEGELSAGTHSGPLVNEHLISSHGCTAPIWDIWVWNMAMQQYKQHKECASLWVSLHLPLSPTPLQDKGMEGGHSGHPSLPPVLCLAGLPRIGAIAEPILGASSLSRATIATNHPHRRARGPARPVAVAIGRPVTIALRVFLGNCPVLSAEFVPPLVAGTILRTVTAPVLSIRLPFSIPAPRVGLPDIRASPVIPPVVPPIGIPVVPIAVLILSPLQVTVPPMPPLLVTDLTIWLTKGLDAGIPLAGWLRMAVAAAAGLWRRSSLGLHCWLVAVAWGGPRPGNRTHMGLGQSPLHRAGSTAQLWFQMHRKALASRRSEVRPCARGVMLLCLSAPIRVVTLLEYTISVMLKQNPYPHLLLVGALEIAAPVVLDSALAPSDLVSTEIEGSFGLWTNNWISL